MADKKRSRLSSTVVVPPSSRREARDRSRSPKHSESHRDRRSSRESRKQDNPRRRSPHQRSTDHDDNNDDLRENKQRRDWQNERIPARDRLGFTRNNPRQPRQIHVEIITDPRDVPRGKRYFEHDDRESFNNQNFNSINRRRSFPRQRSRSPVWKHDYFEEEQRQTRLERSRQERPHQERTHQERSRQERFGPTWRQRERNAGSPVWRHDKFEEMESQDTELKADKGKDTSKERKDTSKERKST